MVMTIIRYILFPVSIIYWVTIKIRNFFFDINLIKSVKPEIKTICVGNITVGGTGKTPHTEYLINLLAQHTQLAVLSRGYRRKTKGYFEAKSASTATQVGDEPLQMKLKFPQITIAVDEDRTDGITQIQKNHPETKLILLDDAFQHRKITPGFSLLLTDYSNLIYNDVMIPTGHLRDSFAERRRANMVVVTKCPQNLNARQMQKISERLKLKPEQDVFFSYIKYGYAMPVFDSTGAKIKIDKTHRVFAISGIAKPTSFIEYLENSTNFVGKQVFSDHHSFTKTEIRTIFEPFCSNYANDVIIVTTEKDAARLRDIELPDAVKQRLYYLQIEVGFIDNQADKFNNKIIQYVRAN